MSNKLPLLILFRSNLQFNLATPHGCFRGCIKGPGDYPNPLNNTDRSVDTSLYNTPLLYTSDFKELALYPKTKSGREGTLGCLLHWYPKFYKVFLFLAWGLLWIFNWLVH